MALDDRQLEVLAARLSEARRTRSPVPALTDDRPSLTTAEGYRIQQTLADARLRAGDRVAGWKVGLTSAAPRARLGIHEPILGRVFASTVHLDGAAIDVGRLVAPAAEAEIAFLLREPLAGPGVTAGRALSAVEGCLAALEIVDCPYREWKFKGPDAVADNGLGAGIVVGTRPVPLGDLDLTLEGLLWEHNGEMVGTATGAEVIGTPLGSLVWLANRLAEWGLSLQPGDIVLSGSLSKVLRLRAGDSIRARFTHLGSVSARFV